MGCGRDCACACHYGKDAQPRKVETRLPNATPNDMAALLALHIADGIIHCGEPHWVMGAEGRANAVALGTELGRWLDSDALGAERATVALGACRVAGVPK